MLTLRSEREISMMRKPGLLVWHALQIASRLVAPGVKTGTIDQAVEAFYEDQESIPLFKGVPGRVPFPAVTCISINEEVVHGIPGDRALEEGDIVSIDTGCKKDGWCGDSAVTFSVGEIDAQKRDLLDVTRQTLDRSIEKMKTADYWSEVATEMEAFVKEHRYSVVERLVGHGIGREMHEEPQVPNYPCPDMIRYGDFKIQPGLVIAIEPMVNVGTKKVRLEKDHWTMTTADRKPSAHFEHTVAMTREGPFVLTAPPRDDSEKIDISKYCG